MRKLAPLAVAGLWFAAGAAAADAPGRAADGLWASQPDEEGTYIEVRVRRCEDAPAKLCGWIESVIDGEGAPLSEAEVLGDRIFWDMALAKPGRWKGGKVLAPDNGKTYRAKLELKDEATLAVAGCVFGGLICRGQDWRRVE